MRSLVVTPLETALWPLSVLHSAAARLRARAYRRAGILRPRRLDGVVISVGNLTVGGTGKTPMTLWIATRLAKEGKRVGILTRGYRGESPRETEATSDEARLLSSRLGGRVPIGVGADRFARGRELAMQGVEWFVLDDGFQRLQLARDVDIVLIDATNPFGGGHLLPAGRLREPKSALGRADIIVITRSERAPAVEAAVRRESNAPIFYAQAQLDAIRSISDGPSGAAVAPAALGPAFAFCAIGNPAAFLADLRDWGIRVAGQKTFRDHHRFTEGDAQAILRESAAAGAACLICTEKDVQNLRSGPFGKYPVFFCEISLQIAREHEFWRALMERAGARQAARESAASK
jgi:tetraacyldisaccharide 4'-kinase